MTPVKVPSLDEIATRPDQVRALPRRALLELALRCSTAQGAIVAALAAAVDTAPGRDEDRLLTVAEAATVLGRKADWLYRHADALPFTVREPGHQPRFSWLGIQRYISRQVATQATRRGA